jgi:hypothetical protein
MRIEGESDFGSSKEHFEDHKILPRESLSSLVPMVRQSLREQLELMAFKIDAQEDCHREIERLVSRTKLSKKFKNEVMSADAEGLLLEAAILWSVKRRLSI